MMVLIALAFVLGAFCLQIQPVLPAPYWGMLPAGTLFLHFGVAHRRFFGTSYSASTIRLVLLIFSSFLLGFFWAAMLAGVRMSDALSTELQNKTMTLVGVVASPVERLEHGERFRFDVEQVLNPSLTKNAQVPQHISLSYYALDRTAAGAASVATLSTTFKVGERWQIAAKLKRPHGTQNPHGYDFEGWALAENIRATGTIKTKAPRLKLQSFVWHPKYVVEYLRDGIKQRIANILQNQPYSGVVQALVMGDDAGIAADDWQLFLRTGTTHLMSISGLHITMLSGLAFALVGVMWRRYPSWVMWLPVRKAATLAGVIVALVYVLLAGFAVPAQRTLYMLLVFAVALWSGRQFRISHVLSLAVLIVTILDPWAVISAGFWLSFSAVAILAYSFSARIGTDGWFKSALRSQWVVTVGMLPLLLIMFHQASIIAPIANAFAIPLVSFVVTPLALMGSFLPIDVLLKLAHFSLEVCMQMLHWLNQAPSLVWQQHAPPVWTWLPASLGVLWMLLPRGFPLKSMGLIGLLPMLLSLPDRVPVGDMKIAILDVGQGLSVVVQTADHTLLYDAGPKSSAQSDAAKRVILPFLQGEGIGRLDAFVLSHDDMDHAGGMATLVANLPIKRVLSSLSQERVSVTPEIKHHHCEAGQQWIWDGVQFEMLHPLPTDQDMSDNNRSCVLRVKSRSGSLLLAGDIERLAEQQILMRLTSNSGAPSIKTNVLIAPHHGSKTSSTFGFIAATSPDLTVFTNGYLNRFRHPHPEVVSRYTAAGSNVLRSDYDGAILLDFSWNHPARSSANLPYQITRWRQHYQRYWHDRYS